MGGHELACEDLTLAEGILERDVREIKAKLDRFPPSAQDVRIGVVEDSCDDIISLAKEVAQIKGVVETQNKLMWFMVLTLFGIFIQGLFS